MSDKHTTTSRNRDAKPGKHGAFKHVAKPATFADVLRAYDLSETEYRKVRDYVHSRMGKEPAHAR